MLEQAFEVPIWHLKRFPVLKSQFVTSSLEVVASKVVRNPRSQIVTLESGANIKHLPFAFTEQGVAMLSSVLRSRRAVLVNVAIMRAFVRLRELLATHKDLARRLDALEQKYDVQFKAVFDAIRELMKPSEPPRHRIGFHAG